MTLPTIRLNGTAAADLYAQAERVAAAARDLILALEAATPNGRDYYTQGPAAMGAASAEHEARVRAVVQIRNDAGALMEHASERM